MNLHYFDLLLPCATRFLHIESTDTDVQTFYCQSQDGYFCQEPVLLRTDLPYILLVHIDAFDIDRHI